MQNSRAQRKKPAYPIEAVDNAIQLMQLLRDVGALRLKDAASELGLTPSSAHRLLAMLVYRGYAVQDEARRYLPGPSMGIGPAGMVWTRQLRSIAQPHLEMLAAALDETANLMIRVGTKVRFLSTVESTNLLRVGDRQGTILPAHRASGGKAMLAEMDPQTLEKLFRSRNAELAGDMISDSEYPGFLREMAATRSKGFAGNFEDTEEGINALGMALHDRDQRVIGAISVAIPSQRFRRVFDSGLVAAARQAQHGIEADISATSLEDYPR